MNKRFVAIALLAGFALISAACGGGSESTEPAAAEEVVAAPTVVPVNEESPIETLLGVPVFDDDAMQKWFEELDVERQRITAQCMISEGFDYVPETAPQARAQQVEFATDSREFAAAYGFGIGHAFNAATYDPDADYSTANSIYVASLSEGEMEAYYTALYGPQPAEGDDFNGPPTEGCEGAAFQEVFSVMNVLFELEPLANGYYDQILADSRMIELTATWQRCMSEAGFVYEGPDEMQDSFYPKLDQIISQDAMYEATDLPDDLPGESLFSVGDTYGYHPKLNAQGQAEIDDFIATEIATAVAHWDCREPLVEEELAIQREYEAKFVVEAAPLVQDQLGG